MASFRISGTVSCLSLQRTSIGVLMLPATFNLTSGSGSVLNLFNIVGVASLLPAMAALTYLSSSSESNASKKKGIPGRLATAIRLYSLLLLAYSARNDARLVFDVVDVEFSRFFWNDNPPV